MQDSKKHFFVFSLFSTIFYTILFYAHSLFFPILASGNKIYRKKIPIRESWWDE